MSKKRVVNTHFWQDEYISNLDPIEKLLFLYFLTCPSTEICGIYEVPLKTIAVDSGIDKEMVLKIIKRLSKDKKIYYKNGWVMIPNFHKHQNLNPSIITGMKASLKYVPKQMLKKLKYEIITTQSGNRLSETKSNLNKKQKESNSKLSETGTVDEGVSNDEEARLKEIKDQAFKGKK